MRLTFHGAAEIVTGSCFLLEVADKRILIDCGLFQGSKALNERNYGALPFDPRSIDAVLLTHAHIDHSGLLPKLVRHGFDGPIYTSEPTRDLLRIMLADSAHIQESEVSRLNRRRARRGQKLLEPIYTAADAEKTCNLVVTKPLGARFQLAPEITIGLWPAGHMLGAASITVEHTPRTGEPQRIAFSGDIGVAEQPLIVDVAKIPEVDTVVMESTYGNRPRHRNEDRYNRLAEIVRKTFARGGNVIIPAFAVGRVQDLLYGLHRLIHSGELDPANVIVDSPLAAKATDIFCNHVESFDEEAQRFANIVGDCPLYLRDLRITRTAEESMALNKIKSGAIIISSSGMCDAGRIKHHLRHNLWRKECSVVMVSYQAVGTLGRRITDGASAVRIHGDSVAVEAEIHTIDGFSAHADQEELVSWVRHLPAPPKRVYLVHGESGAQTALQERIEQELDVPVFIPRLDESVELMPTTVETVVSGVAPVKELQEQHPLWEAFANLKDSLDELERLGAPQETIDDVIAALERARQTVKAAGA